MLVLLKKNLLAVVLCLITTQVIGQENKYFTRFYLKFQPSLHFNAPNDLLNIETINLLKQDFDIKITNAYSLSSTQIEALEKQSKSNHTLKNTFKIEAFLDDEASKKVLNKLQKLSGLIYAYQANTTPIKPPHDIAPTTSNFENNQGYIEPNPGLNVRHAWNNGVNGAGVNIRTVEYGINTNHEDLDHTNAFLAPNTTINSSATVAYTEHGTKVAGAIFADNGIYGVSGLAHGANEYILYPEWTEEYGYNRVLAVSNAIANSSAGDIIIYEMQTTGQNGEYVLAEYSQAIWDLTKAATDAGIVIVAAAGNGGENLDDVFYNSYNARGDSGAIIVGAGSSNTAHNKLSFSTYGSRVNIQAWGQNVYTTGQGSCDIVIGNDFNQTYSSCFNGTSSATALAGGFTAVLQSYNFALTGSYLTSQELRNLIVTTGIPQGSGGNIGPFPNMEAAMLALENTLSVKTENSLVFNMYPNPSNGILNINLKNANNATSLKIHNVLAQQVFSKKLNRKNNTISLKNLSKGLYLVTLENENTITTKKLVIN